MVEHSAVNRRVASSNLARGAILLPRNQISLDEFISQLIRNKNYPTKYFPTSGVQKRMGGLFPSRPLPVFALSTSLVD
jgi:hypothetical protein